MALSRVALLQILVIILGLSYIRGSNAVPITRTKTLTHHDEYPSSFQPSMKSHDHLLDTHQESSKQRREMKVELEDYPGSGPNNRHTPRAAQFDRGCVDC